ADCRDPVLVGGTAVGLSRLLAAGLSVPDGCCITTRAYDEALATIGFDARERWQSARRLPADDRRTQLMACRERILRAQPSAVLEAVHGALHRVAAGPPRTWALRSSATNEDSATLSAAGLYRTILGARSDELARGIAEVWASIWDERVMEYMVKAGSGDLPPSMAVVIQPLLDATIAGVAYSIHPVTGRCTHVAIDAVKGLGQPLVDGRVMPDQYVVEAIADQPLRMIRRIQGQQGQRLVPAAGSVAMEPLTAFERTQPALSDQQAFDVATMTKRIERSFQSPVDVEWAIDSQRLWTLQARPITTVRARADATDDESEWSRANFKETMPEVPSPMGLSFLEHFMEAYILAQYRRLGCRVPAGLHSVRVHQGRPYLNVTLFYLLVGQLGGDPAMNMEQMGGRRIQSPPPVRPLKWLALLRAAWLMWREMQRAVRQGPAVFAEMKALSRRYSRDRVQGMSEKDVHACLDELGRWLEPREMTFGIAAGTGQCLQAFSRLLPQWLGADWRRLLNESLQGQGTVISADQIIRIAQMVELARTDAGLSGPAFLSAFERYLEDYGHRAVGESDIMSPRLADQPEALMEVIRIQVAGPPTVSDELIRRQRAVRDRALHAIRACCGWRLDRWVIFSWWYRRLCRFFALRESNRHHLMWYSLAARHLLLRLGQLLVDRGVFTQKEDVFFLMLKEREDLERAPAAKWKAVIQARRAEHERWNTIEVPDTIRGWDGVVPRDEESQQEVDSELRGIPVSSGIVTGPVRFVRATTDWRRVRPGDIIVASVIDPGMAPLFGVAGGLIVEMGGTLSHGAIIAREYGLPTVANVVRAMCRLTEGERVTIDAGRGLVRREAARSRLS
ncbi:MAG TPA: PEP/pyruvate-binding domain-containing protein, partial [Nitrospira sp.]|nr:PEP/pyruvate-binding domain-containing protein [Nitrospira sp.]